MSKNKNRKYNDNVSQAVTDVIKEFPNSVKNRESAMIHDCASNVEIELSNPNIAIEACEKLITVLQEYKDRYTNIRLRELLDRQLIKTIDKLKDTNITENDSDENKSIITDYYRALESLYTKITYLEWQELDAKISTAYEEFFKTFVNIIRYL